MRRPRRTLMKPVAERPGPGRRFISCRQCAELLGLHEMTIRVMVNRGTLPGVKIGGAVRIDTVKLEKVLEAQSLAPKKAAR